MRGGRWGFIVFRRGLIAGRLEAMSVLPDEEPWMMACIQIEKLRDVLWNLMCGAGVTSG